MKDQLFMKLTTKDGKLHFPNKGLKTRLEKFFKNLPEGANIELFVGASTSKGSLPQKAKLHASIRELAHELGYTFEEMKLNVKRQAGLCIVTGGVEYCKSFGECDSTELSLAIQSCIDIADFNGIQLR
tara:strand:+ start:3254 stop:3637 length:384 start_codon:yes stop_codon:yes gene_type:complete